MAKYDLIRAHHAGREATARAAGLRSVACTVPGCLAEDYWVDGDRRDEKRARKWITNHKKHSRI